jgi:hypothetical protein
VADGLVDGAEQLRRKVRELVRAGADVIKVATSGGVLSPTDDPRHAHCRQDELTAPVAEAAAAGRWVMAHAQGADGVKAAVRAGIRSVDGDPFGLAGLPDRVAAVWQDGRLVAGRVCAGPRTTPAMPAAGGGAPTVQRSRSLASSRSSSR